ncbi:MAG: VOC family protein [Rhodobacteraceae bacterium]|uniref:VOC family protein n=1 Tax=Amaricoccus sp. TaxID=1872485 RepID=UPI001DAD3485|nr:VOC family protein [Amaricoccus sp.]MCB1375681.1 VOC family protein [Paracoccaceae bacterium]MCC0066692.1 VOC family protein [Rhodovulum sp.]HRW14914.1 VOC family protein [Amaricoccus sp.]
MIDHVGISVSDFAQSHDFYRAALEPLGVTVQMEVTAEQTGGQAFTGFGTEGKPFFWIGTGVAVSRGTHVAFAAASRSEVDAFHAAAMKAGGRDNGKPGLRPQYHPDYYGAFVYDPDGNNIEAVCHRPA